MNLNNVNLKFTLRQVLLVLKIIGYSVCTDIILIGVGVRMEPVYGVISEPFWSFGLYM